MKKQSTLNHYRINTRLGTFTFITHRLTGITLIISGIIMLLGLSVIMFGRVAFEELLITLKLPLFVILAHTIAIIFFWHVLNGLRILLIDIFKLGRIQEILTWIIIAAFAVGLVLYFVYVFPSAGGA